MFVIADEFHGEHHGKYASLADAMNELRRLAEIPWDQAPNVAPCTSWQTCGRRYVIVEYASSGEPEVVRRLPALSISADASEWLLPRSMEG